MNKENFKRILKKRRVYLFVIGVIVIGLIPIPLKGIQFGMDFRGGTMLDLSLEKKVDTAKMKTIVGLLQKRVNTYGLKDVSVTPQENKYIRVEVAETDPKTVEQIKSIVGQQGSFETLYEGEIILKGSQIGKVITNPQKGYGARKAGSGYRWRVPFRVSITAAKNFANAVEGECTPQPNSDSCKELLYMYIDRPKNSVVVMNSTLYQEEKSISPSLTKEEDTQSKLRKNIPIEKVVENSNSELLIKDHITSKILNKTENRTVLVPEEMYSAKELEVIGNAEEVKELPRVEGYWIVQALNLENIVHLTPGITSGNPVTQPSITGYSKTAAEAKEDMNRIQVLLKSGKLPVGVNVEKVNQISPVLGQRFLNYSLIAGAAAILLVVSTVSIRYRRPKIVLPLLLTSLSEVLMTVGAAAWIGWQIDLPGIAGIIAVVGTGVDHQIIMTDEATGETKRKRSLARRVKKAFSIIFRASTTTIFAMFPLLFMGLGALQGFAIVTILGTLIGVLISRPAYGAMINELL